MQEDDVEDDDLEDVVGLDDDVEEDDGEDVSPEDEVEDYKGGG